MYWMNIWIQAPSLKELKTLSKNTYCTSESNKSLKIVDVEPFFFPKIVSLGHRFDSITSTTKNWKKTINLFMAHFFKMHHLLLCCGSVRDSDFTVKTTAAQVWADGSEEIWIDWRLAVLYRMWKNWIYQSKMWSEKRFFSLPNAKQVIRKIKLNLLAWNPRKFLSTGFIIWIWVQPFINVTLGAGTIWR